MKIVRNQSGSTAVFAIAAVVVVAVAVVAFAVVHNKNKNTMVMTTASNSASITPSALALNNSLVTLGVEHMTLTDQAVDATLDGSKDASAVGAALYANGNNIGKAVGSVYGSSAESTFDSVWKLHLDEFVAYAGAAAKGDSAGKQAALNTINTKYTIPLAQFLAKANPNLPENAVQTLLSDHVAMTAKIIDEHVSGNYTQEQADMSDANTMMTKIMSTLAGAIAKQYPSKFAN